MKSMMTLMLFFTFSAHAALIDDVKPFLNKTGNGTEFGNDIGTCSISLEDDYLSLEGNFYFPPNVELSAKLDSKTSQETVYLSKYNGKRPGGDQCGDFGGMVGFQQVAKINKKNRTVSIINSFRCTFEGFKKTVLDWSCKF